MARFSKKKNPFLNVTVFLPEGSQYTSRRGVAATVRAARRPKSEQTLDGQYVEVITNQFQTDIWKLMSQRSGFSLKLSGAGLRANFARGLALTPQEPSFRQGYQPAAVCDLKKRMNRGKLIL